MRELDRSCILALMRLCENVNKLFFFLAAFKKRELFAFNRKIRNSINNRWTRTGE